MSSKALVPVQAKDWNLIQSVAPVAAASRMFGITPQQAAIVMLKGMELGLGMATAFEFIHVIPTKGLPKPSVSPKGCLALIHRSGKLAKLEIKDLTDPQGNPTRCKVTMERTNGFTYTSEFGMADAKRANLVKSDSGWEKYPANMLRWRAVGYCADVVFPDVIGGLYRSEELGAVVDESGEPVITLKVAPPIADTVTISAADSIAVPPQPIVTEEVIASQPDLSSLTLDQLLKQWTAEQIVAAHEGRIPATSEECQAVKEKLEAEA